MFRRYLKCRPRLPTLSPIELQRWPDPTEVAKHRLWPVRTLEFASDAVERRVIRLTSAAECLPWLPITTGLLPKPSSELQPEVEYGRISNVAPQNTEAHVMFADSWLQDFVYRVRSTISGAIANTVWAGEALGLSSVVLQLKRADQPVPGLHLNLENAEESLSRLVLSTVAASRRVLIWAGLPRHHEEYLKKRVHKLVHGRVLAHADSALLGQLEDTIEEHWPEVGSRLHLLLSEQADCLRRLPLTAPDESVGRLARRHDELQKQLEPAVCHESFHQLEEIDVQVDDVAEVLDNRMIDVLERLKEQLALSDQIKRWTVWSHAKYRVTAAGMQMRDFYRPGLLAVARNTVLCQADIQNEVLVRRMVEFNDVDVPVENLFRLTKHALRRRPLSAFRLRKLLVDRSRVVELATTPLTASMFRIMAGRPSLMFGWVWPTYAAVLAALPEVQIVGSVGAAIWYSTQRWIADAVVGGLEVGVGPGPSRHGVLPLVERSQAALEQL